MGADDIAAASDVLEAEATAIRNVIQHLDESFSEAVELILACNGRVAVSGMGKAGQIGEKISATLASTGTPSFFLHPAEAIHGDLGRLRVEDVFLALSNSGESDEIVRLVDPLKSLGTPIVAISGASKSRLAQHADCHLNIGDIDEACPLGLAPTSSTTAMLALGDALAMAVLRRRNFDREDYARFHPGGSLGRQLMKVEELMRRGEETTVVPSDTSAFDTLSRINETRGRPGAASVVDGQGVLVGFVTDGDLIRALENGHEFLGRPITEVMTKDPKTIGPTQLVSEAAKILRENRIDQIPVVDDNHLPVGLLDLQDLADARMP